MWESITAGFGLIALVLARAYKAKKYEDAARNAVARLHTSQLDIARVRETLEESTPDQIDEQLNGIMRETHRTLMVVETSLPKFVNELRGRLSETPGHGD